MVNIQGKSSSLFTHILEGSSFTRHTIYSTFFFNVKKASNRLECQIPKGQNTLQYSVPKLTLRFITKPQKEENEELRIHQVPHSRRMKFLPSICQKHACQT